MMEKISIDEFKKVEIRVGEIRSAEKVLDADKLLRLVVNFGTEERQVISGIAAYFPDLTTLVGKHCLFVTNLEYRTIRGLESQAMIMAAGGELIPDGSGTEPLYLFETHAELGSRVR
jgi:methionine--tRNA ligase beta chain